MKYCFFRSAVSRRDQPGLNTAAAQVVQIVAEPLLSGTGAGTSAERGLKGTRRRPRRRGVLLLGLTGMGTPDTDAYSFPRAAGDPVARLPPATPLTTVSFFFPV